MKVLIVSMDCVSEGLGLAVKCKRAGHAVRLWLDPKNNKTSADGFKGIEKVDNWLASVKWADLIVPTGNHAFMQKMDALRKMGANIFGPSAESASLEIEREKGMKFFEKHGVKVPEYKTFKTLKDAEVHVRKTEKRYVFKTMGDEDDKSLSYCGKSPADMIARLMRWQKLNMKLKGEVMLQEFVDGQEFAVSRWIGKEGFVGEYNENFEHKKLLAGNCGPNCGEAGTVMKYVSDSKIGDAVLAPLEKALVEMGHLGDFDVNCIVTDKGEAYALEPTARLGWPAANIFWASHKGDPAQWMLDACKGMDSLEVSPQVAVGIVIAQPDYPYSKLTKAETDGIPVYGVTKDNEKNIAPQCVKIETMPNMEGDKVVDKPTWVTTGDYVCVVTALGKTVSSACDRAYKTVKELHIPDIIYRSDIGKKLEEEIPKLQKNGYATEFEY